MASCHSFPRTVLLILAISLASMCSPICGLKIVPIGNQCHASSSKCHISSVCAINRCRIRVGKECTKYPKFCISGSRCVGPKNKKLCLKPVPIGGKCDNVYFVCLPDLACQGTVGNKRCKIKEGKPCKKHRGQCAAGLACVGTSTTKKCKVLMKPGGRCTDPFWRCEPPLKCQRVNKTEKLCKIPENRSCTRYPKQCVTGTFCVGPSHNKKCRKPVGPGARCDHDSCKSGLICQSTVHGAGKRCKIREGQSCVNHRNQCQQGLVCIGAKNKFQCQKLLGAGSRCSDTFSKCQPHLVCEGLGKDLRCKIRQKGSCLNHRSLCASGLACLGNDKKRECRKFVKPGQKCDNILLQCDAAVSKCEKSRNDRVCKLIENQGCSKFPTHCTSGTYCLGIGSKKTCKKLMGPGGRCGNPSLQCESTLKCEGHGKSKECKIRVGSSCSKHPVECQSGAACTGNGSDRKCRKPVSVGGGCTVDFNVCASHLVCDIEKRGISKKICKIKENEGCLKHPRHCVSGTSCVGTLNRKMCKKPIGPGGRCPDPFWKCRKGLMCQGKKRNKTCRIRLGGVCTRSPKACESGTRCLSSEGSNEKKCIRSVKLGNDCSNKFTICAESLVCNNEGSRKKRCRLPENANCLGRPSQCMSGTKCVGTAKVKICKRLIPVGGFCPDPFWKCEPGLTCFSNVCRIPLNGKCTSSTEKFCLQGLACANNGRCSRHIGAGVGESCVEGKCRPGVICQGGKCRARKGDTCKKNEHCIDGTKCSKFIHDHRCFQEVSGGSNCGARWLQVCEAGFLCYNRKCYDKFELPAGASCGGNGRKCGHGLKCKQRGNSGHRCSTF